MAIGSKHFALFGLATLMLVAFANLSGTQQSPAGVQVTLSGSRSADRFGPPVEFKFEVTSGGTRRVVTLPASAGSSSVTKFFAVGRVLFVVGASPSGWRIHRLDLETSHLIDSIASPSTPVASSDGRYLAFLHSEPRGVAALEDETLMVLDTSTGTRRAVFPESHACTSQEYLAEADRNFLTSIDSAFLWSVDGKLLIFLSRPRMNQSAVQLVGVDLSGGLQTAPIIARRLLDLTSTQRGSGAPKDLSLVGAEHLEWTKDGKVHIAFRDGGGGPDFFLDAAVPNHGAAPCGPGGPKLLVRDNEMSGVTIKLSTAFRWFKGTGADGSLLFVDGIQQLLIDRQAKSVATVRYALFGDATQAGMGAEFLPAFFGVRLRPWPGEGEGTCPGTSCWVAEGESVSRLLIQRGAFLVWVNGYNFSFWDNGEPGSNPADRAKLVNDVAQVILSSTGGDSALKPE